MSNKIFLENLWRWKCGLEELDINSSKDSLSYESLKETEWCKEFEEKMRNRLVMGVS